jgi:glycosyltransferase involved in cell wall biosynthesis
MKVLFISRATIFSVPGGDTVQMEYTAKELMNLGIEVTILDNLSSVEYEKYDLLHFFNLTRPASILFHTRKCNLPYVVSTIFVQYDFYKLQNPWSKMGLATRIFGLDGIEYLKTVAKHFLGIEKLNYLPFLFMGQRNSIKMVLKGAAAILPNSVSEANRVAKIYKVYVESFVVPNGIDFENFEGISSIVRNPNQLICVGQIEPRKNQLNLIKAIKDLNVTLLIIGNSAPNHGNYLEECKELASDNVEFISRINQEELVKYYQSSSVHILPSWFETTGLSSLEAAYLGCKVVVSPNGDTQDYFGEYANYCNPGSVNSITKAIENALDRSYSSRLKELIIEEFNWKKTAEKTKNCYESIRNKI